MHAKWVLGAGAVSLVAATGCSGAFAKGDGQAFGDDLGRFHVLARLDSSTCGPAALDTPEKWEFDVILSRSEPHIYWNTGADAVQGDLDGTRFSFESETVANGGGDGGGVCTIVRRDSASGELDDAKAAKAFQGSLSYRFAAAGRADCSEAMLEGGFATLPCSLAYRMSGAWVSAR